MCGTGDFDRDVDLGDPGFSGSDRRLSLPLPLPSFLRFGRRHPALEEDFAKSSQDFLLGVLGHVPPVEFGRIRQPELPFVHCPNPPCALCGPYRQLRHISIRLDQNGLRAESGSASEPLQKVVVGLALRDVLRGGRVCQSQQIYGLPKVELTPFAEWQQW